MAISDDFSLRDVLNVNEEEPARPKIDFDFRSALTDLTQNQGMTRNQANRVITEQLAERANFDLDSALKEGYTNAEIQSALTGVDQRKGLGVISEKFAREFVPTAGGLAVLAPAFKATSNLLKKVSLPGPAGKAVSFAASIATGVIADKILTKGTNVVLGEEEQILPESTPYRRAGETAGIVAGFLPSTVNLLKSIPKTFEAKLGSQTILSNLAKNKTSPTIGRKVKAGILGPTASVLSGVEKGVTSVGRALANQSKKAAIAGGISVGVLEATAGGISEQLDPGDIETALMSELGAGFFPSPQKIVASSVGSVKKGVSKVSTRFSKTGRETQAAEALNEAISKINASGQMGEVTAKDLIKSMDEAIDLLGPEVALTPSQLTGSPVFQLLEKYAVGSQRGKLELESKASAEAGLAKIEELVYALRQNGGPEALEMAAKLRVNSVGETLEAHISDVIKNSTDKAQQLKRRGKNITDEDALLYTDRSVYDALKKAQTDARGVEKNLYAPLNKSTTVVPVNKTISAYKKVTGEFGEKALRDTSAEQFYKKSLTGSSKEVQIITEDVLASAITRGKNAETQLAQLRSQQGMSNNDFKAQLKTLQRTSWEKEKKKLAVTVPNFKPSTLIKADYVNSTEFTKGVLGREENFALKEFVKHTDTVKQSKATATAARKGSGRLEEAYGATVGNEISLGEIVQLRSNLLKQQNNFLSGATPDKTKAFQLGKIIKAVDDDLESFQAKILGTADASLPEFAQLTDARTFSRAYNDAFSRNFVGDSFKKKGTGAMAKSPEMLLDELFLKGKSNDITRKHGQVVQALTFLEKNGEAARIARKYNKDGSLDNIFRSIESSEQTLGNAESKFLRELLISGKNRNPNAPNRSVFTDVEYPVFKNGKFTETKTAKVIAVDENRVNAFFSDYAEVMGAKKLSNGQFGVAPDSPFFDLVEDLNKTETRKTLLDSFRVSEKASRAAGETGENVAPGIFWKQVNEKKNLSRFLDNEDPTVVVANIFNSVAPKKEFEETVNQIRRFVKDPKQLQDAKSTLNDSIFNYILKSSKGAGATVSPIKVLEKLRSPMVSGGEETLEAFLLKQKLLNGGSQTQMDQFKKLMTAMSNVEVSLKGGVPNVTPEAFNNLSGASELAARIFGAGLGTSIAGGLNLNSGLIAASSGSKYVTNMFGKVPNVMIMDLLVNASKPGAQSNDFMKALLAKSAGIRDAKAGAKSSESAIADFLTAYVGSANVPAIGFEYATAEPAPEPFVAPQQRPANLDNIANVPERSAAFDQIRSPIPAPQPMAPAPRPAGPSPQRSQYASLFPNDITSSIINSQPQQTQQGIGSLRPY
mgnify:FL=1